MSKAIDEALLTLYEEREKIDTAIDALEDLNGMKAIESTPNPIPASPATTTQVTARASESPALATTRMLGRSDTIVAYITDHDGITQEKAIAALGGNDPLERKRVYATMYRLIQQGKLLSAGGRIYAKTSASRDERIAKLNPQHKDAITTRLQKAGAMRFASLCHDLSGGKSPLLGEIRKAAQDMIDLGLIKQQNQTIMLPGVHANA